MLLVLRDLEVRMPPSSPIKMWRLSSVMSRHWIGAVIFSMKVSSKVSAWYTLRYWSYEEVMSREPWLTTLTPETIFLLFLAWNSSFPVLTSHSDILFPPTAAKVNPEGNTSIDSNCSWWLNSIWAFSWTLKSNNLMKQSYPAERIWLF